MRGRFTTTRRLAAMDPNRATLELNRELLPAIQRELVLNFRTEGQGQWEPRSPASELVRRALKQPQNTPILQLTGKLFARVTRHPDVEVGLNEIVLRVGEGGGYVDKYAKIHSTGWYREWLYVDKGTEGKVAFAEYAATRRKVSVMKTTDKMRRFFWFLWLQFPPAERKAAQKSGGEVDVFRRMAITRKPMKVRLPKRPFLYLTRQAEWRVRNERRRLLERALTA